MYRHTTYRLAEHHNDIYDDCGVIYSEKHYEGQQQSSLSTGPAVSLVNQNVTEDSGLLGCYAVSTGK